MSLQPLNPSPLQLTKTFSGKKVFVTGHTGFKGSWLCEWLLKLGAQITGFSLPQVPTQPSLFEQLDLGSRINDLRGDVRDFPAVQAALHAADPDFVFHLAAQPLVRLSYQFPLETYGANVMGTAHVLEALRTLSGAGGAVEMLKGKRVEQLISPTSPRPIVAVMVTTDKCYENREWHHGYREADPMGGHDPYSSSKGAAELVIASYRSSFFNSHPPTFASVQRPVALASARAGNVIGGGDWALDRIVPDAIRSLRKGEAIPVRMPHATRPWQHVLEPLGGYLTLAAHLAAKLNGGTVELLKGASLANPSTPQPFHGSTAELCSAFNFGPALASNRPVRELVEEMLKHWPGGWQDISDSHALHEAHLLNLATDKAFHLLGWQPVWNFSNTLKETVSWYRQTYEDPACVAALTSRQIQDYQTALEA